MDRTLPLASTGLLLLRAACQAPRPAAEPAPPAGARAAASPAPDREPAFTEEEGWSLHTVEVPEGIVLEAGGLLELPDGALLVSTRRGEVWRIEEPAGPEPRFQLFAEGLQEPLGLLLDTDGESVLTAERGGVTRLRDLDGDGRADRFENVCDDWEISGNYHEYAFGPRRDPEGNLWVTLNKPFGEEPFGRVPWRGWAVRITPEGEMQPVCAGLRSPAGIEVAPWGEVFYTDNQGEWCGAGKLSILKEGSFHGHPWGIESCRLPESRVPHPGAVPDGMLMPEVPKLIPNFELPVVWFPYDKMGKSPSGMVWDTSGGAFGPFDGQLFVGDQHHAWVMRVALEQVNGRWQGSCHAFRQGFVSGIVRLSFGRGPRLWAGMSNRGWGSRGTAPWGLQWLEWTGRLPFEIHHVEARPDGFRLVFTGEVDPAAASDPDGYSLSSFTYLLHSSYGSDEVDKKSLRVLEARVAEDRRSVDLRVKGLRAGYVHEILAHGPRSADGRRLLHPSAWYTLIEIPGPGS